VRLTHLPEPPLEFAGAMRHVDIRFGLMDYGPFDRGMEGAPRRIRLGIVGSGETVEGTARWLEACRSGFSAKPSRQPNLFPPFSRAVLRRIVPMRVRYLRRAPSSAAAEGSGKARRDFGTAGDDARGRAIDH